MHYTKERERKKGEEWRWQKQNVHVPSGTAIEIPVSTIAFPLAGMTHSFALYRSYPAANADPLVGASAFGTNFFTSREGICVVDVMAVVSSLEESMMEAIDGSLVSSTVLLVVVEVDDGLFRFGRGDEGSDGGS
jgi:hypothetical protein